MKKAGFFLLPLLMITEVQAQNCTKSHEICKKISNSLNKNDSNHCNQCLTACNEALQVCATAKETEKVTSASGHRVHCRNACASTAPK